MNNHRRLDKKFKKGGQNQHSVERTKPKKLLMGRNPVGELLKREPERVLKAFVQLHEGRADKKGEEILSLLKKLRIQVKELPRSELSSLCSSEGHQGFALELQEKPILDLQGLLTLADSFDEGIFVALDGVQDPQNLGSIIRVSECLGAKAVFWSHNRSVDITPTVTKVSAGASEILPVAAVSNLRDALDRLKKKGFWNVASIIGDDAQRLHEFSFPKKTCLILGSEGEGVKPLIAKEADFRVFIEQRGITDSLNVGQATSIFLAEFFRQMSLR